MWIIELIKFLLQLLDNTFIGTLFAGLLLASFGLYLYHEQKKVDLEYEEKKKIKESATELLTLIHVSVKDYKDQIKVHNGGNPIAKIILNKIIAMSPDHIAKQTQSRFDKYISDINQIHNNLSTRMSLNPFYKNSVLVLSEEKINVSTYLSYIGFLPQLDIETLKIAETEISKHANALEMTLENIILNL